MQQLNLDLLPEYSWQSNGKRYGPLFYAITDFPSKTIITHSPFAMMHEFALYSYDQVVDNETVEQLFTNEAEQLRADLIGEDLSKAKGFFLEKPEDFYANCFMEYIMAQDNEKASAHLAQVIPLTYAYLSTEVFGENLDTATNPHDDSPF